MPLCWRLSRSTYRRNKRKSHQLRNHHGLCISLCRTVCDIVYRERLANTSDRGGLSPIPRIKAHHQSSFRQGKQNIREDIKKDAAGKGFWPTVGKIAVADLAFAIDSILAAVALALGLPDSPLPDFGGMDGGQFLVVVLGGIAGLVLIKFAATWFVKLLAQRPALETTAYAIVAWVGVKLAVITLAHEDIGVLDHHFPHSTGWTVVFYGVLVAIALLGWFAPSNKSILNLNRYRLN